MQLLQKPYGGSNKGGSRGKGRPGSGSGNMPRLTLEGKHPVSLLHELSSKRRWGVPSYEVAQESGPAHAKCFIFKVKILQTKRNVDKITYIINAHRFELMVSSIQLHQAATTKKKQNRQWQNFVYNNWEYCPKKLLAFVFFLRFT